MKTNYLKKYIISSYILVWILIIFVAGTASLIFHAPPVIMWIVRNLIAWSPTYLLLLGWKHFRPDETRIAFVKRCFSGKVKLSTLLLSFVLTFGISVLSLFLYSVMTGKSMLLNMVVEDMKAKGITPIYLVTDHTSFYERYGWEFLCMVQGEGEDYMTRMYIHR